MGSFKNELTRKAAIVLLFPVFDEVYTFSSSLDLIHPGYCCKKLLQHSSFLRMIRYEATPSEILNTSPLSINAHKTRQLSRQGLPEPPAYRSLR